MATSLKRNWIQRSEADWRALLTRFERSGLSAADFCRHEEISTASLYRWRNLLGQREPGGGHTAALNATPVAEQGGFVDLGEMMAPPPTPVSNRLEIRLDLGAGMILHLVRG